MPPILKNIFQLYIKTEKESFKSQFRSEVRVVSSTQQWIKFGYFILKKNSDTHDGVYPIEILAMYTRLYEQNIHWIVACIKRTEMS